MGRKTQDGPAEGVLAVGGAAAAAAGKRRTAGTADRGSLRRKRGRRMDKGWSSDTSRPDPMRAGGNEKRTR